MALPASTYVPIVADPDATVTALNAAVANLVLENQDYIAVPLFFEDGITICGSTVADPTYFTGLAWDSVPHDWLTDPANMDTFMATIPANQGIRSVVATKFGYDLVVLGVAPGSGSGGTLEFNYTNAAVAAATSVITIQAALLQQSGSQSTFTGAALMGPYTYAAGYRRNSIPIEVVVSQSSGFLPGQTITFTLKVYGDTGGGIGFARFNWVTTAYALPAGATTHLLTAQIPEVHHQANGDGVRIATSATLGFALTALEANLLVTTTGYPSIYGLRVL